MRKFLVNTAKALLLAAIFVAGVGAANTVLRSVAIVSSTVDSSPVGQTSPSTGIFTALADQGLVSGKCVQATTGGLLNTIPLSCGGPIQAVTTKLLAGNAALTGGVLTNLDSQAITMPASGCPCRVLVTYNYFWSSNSATTGNTVSMYVTDGTNILGISQADTVANNANGSLSGTQMSPDYANGATVTFSSKAQTDASSVSIEVFGQIFTANESYMQFTVIPSL